MDDVIIPKKGLMELRKILTEDDEKEIEISIEKPRVVFKNKKTILVVRLIEGNFPNYQKLVPKKFKNKTVFDTVEFINALKRLCLVSGNEAKGVTFEFKKNQVTMVSSHPDTGDGKEELSVDYKGSDMKIKFNAKYILDFLINLKQESVVLETNESTSPGVLRPNIKKNYLYVIMPMKI